MTKSYTLKLGDCHAIMDQLHENSVDAIVTDPPYEINFMAKTWDNAGVAFNPTTWEKALRVLKPGGHMLVFGHSRKMHRIIVAIEDAGFEIRDTLMWLYGSGFPKSHNISKSIDKKLGAEREVVGKNPNYRPISGKKGYLGKPNFRQTNGMENITAPTADLAKQYDGWGTALKPAYEPIVLARKPFKGSIAENVLEHGTGGINIDECRVEGEWKGKTRTNSPETKQVYGEYEKITTEQHPSGRFPANVIHDGSDEVTSGFPETKKAGNVRSSDMTNGTSTFGIGQIKENPAIQGDEGGNASRFFYTAKAGKKDRDEGLVNFEEKRAGSMQANVDDGDFLTGSGNLRRTTRRNTHPTVKPTELMQYLVRLITPKGGTVLDPFMGSGSTGKATMIENNERNANYHFIGIDITEEYIDIAKARIEYGVHYFENKEKEVQNVDENQTTLFDWEWD